MADIMNLPEMICGECSIKSRESRCPQCGSTNWLPINQKSEKPATRYSEKALKDGHINDKWGHAWDEYLPTTFVDIIWAKHQRILTSVDKLREYLAHNGILNKEEILLLDDILDSAIDGKNYARKLREVLSNKNNV